MISEEQYTDATQYPLTSLPGMDYQKQRKIDQFNFDQFKHSWEKDNDLSDEQKEQFQELAQKLEMPLPEGL